MFLILFLNKKADNKQTCEVILIKFKINCLCRLFGFELYAFGIVNTEDDIKRVLFCLFFAAPNLHAQEILIYYWYFIFILCTCILPINPIVKNRKN